MTGESLLNGDKFSNFAVELATLYKGESQKFIQSTFNSIYDIVQGTKESTLFEEADNTPRSLVEAIKETLNFEYDGQQRNRAMAGNHTAGQAGKQGSSGNAQAGERVENGERTGDRGGRVDANRSEDGTDEVDNAKEAAPKTITPEQMALLNENNPHQYPSERELSTGKNTLSAPNKQQKKKKSVKSKGVKTEEEIQAIRERIQQAAKEYNKWLEEFKRELNAKVEALDATFDKYKQSESPLQLVKRVIEQYCSFDEKKQDDVGEEYDKLLVRYIEALSLEELDALDEYIENREFGQDVDLGFIDMIISESYSWHINRKNAGIEDSQKKANEKSISKKKAKKKAESTKAVREQKAVGLTNASSSESNLRDAIVKLLRAMGIEVVTDSKDTQRVLDEVNGKVRAMAFGEEYDYEKYPTGRVEPGLTDRTERIENTDLNHGFANFGDAREWAKSHIVRTLDNEESGGKGNVKISGTAINKYLSESAVAKSDSRDVHLAVLKVLPKVIRESIDVETTPDFKKDEHGFRKPDNPINKDVLIHRCYGAVEINGNIYRVKITLKEYKDAVRDNKAYSYEATKIELLAGTLVGRDISSNPGTNNSISVANLLKDVEMSYRPGVKILEESKKQTLKVREYRFFRTPSGEAYGFTVDGKIYLDPRIATAETPIHEYAHLWADMLRSANPKEWENVVNLMKDSPMWDEVKQLYPDLKTDDEIADEVLAHFSGRRGAERLREAQKKAAAGNGSVFDKAAAIAAIEKVKEALKNFWKGVADLLGIHFTTAEEVADKVMADLLNGVNPKGDTTQPEENITLLDVDGKPIVVKAEDGSVELNYRTWKAEKEDIREALEDGGLEPEAVDAIMSQAEVVAEAVKAMGNTYPVFGMFQNKEAGKQPILRHTGEYISWDYSFNCIKKDALNAVVEMLVAQGKAAHLGITQMEALKKVLQKHGFLTPCVMCYVEAKRKVYKQSKEISDKWNAVAEAAGLSAEKIGEKRELNDEQKQILKDLSEEKGVEQVSNFSVKDGEGIKADTIKKMAKLMLLSPELRGRMEYTDMMSPSSFSAMYNRLAHTGLMEFLTQGQSRGKSLLNAVPFSLNSIPQNLFDDIYNYRKLSRIGGLRQFSYEDARAVMFFDYYQQFMLMQGARALEHLYTKRPFMPEMFGRTGAMMNQSLIVDIFKGADWHREALGMDKASYSEWLRENAGFVPTGALAESDSHYQKGGMELVPYYSVESFPVDIAMQNIHNPAYKSCVGNTIVAPSVKFIHWALDNPDIHMILAYHATGANPVMKSLTGYDLATGMDDGYHTKKDGKTIENLHVREIGLEIRDKVLQWNQLLRKHKDARKAAQVYLDYCKKHGLTPMFNYEGVVDMSGDKAVSHPNYYKLLTDFRVYDDNGQPVTQRSVKLELPENWQEILGRYLQEEQQSGEAIEKIALSDELKQEIEDVTRYASMEPDERSSFVGLLNYIYGKANVEVCNTETFEKKLDASDDGKLSDMLRNRNGMVYGFAAGERIVLNEDLFNAHTPMHEHTHIYMKVLKATNPRLYSRGLELWRNTPLWENARCGLEMLGEEPTEDKIFSECMAQFTGAENEKIISEVTGITDKKWI